MNLRAITCFVLLAFVTLPAPAQRRPDPAPEKPSKEALDAFVKEIKAATKADPADLRDLLERALWMDDPAVARSIARFLEHTDAVVQGNAIRALRYQQNEKALDVLIWAMKRKSIIKDDDANIAIILGVGQHGKKKGIAALTEGIARMRNKKILDARTTALAHIRRPEAIGAAIRMIRMAGRRGGRKGGGDRNRDRREPRGIYLTLFLLTGERLGSDPVAWKKWWDENRRGFEVSESPLGLTERQDRKWKRTWAPPVPPGAENRKDDAPRRPRPGGDG